MTYRWLFGGAVLALTMLGCRPDAPDHDREVVVKGGLGVRLVVQVAIQEPESLYLANPSFMAFSDSGDFWVSDGFYERVVRYGRNGAPEAVVGRKGSGPGEFRSVGLILPLVDGQLAIGDNSLRRLSFFDQESGALMSAIEYKGIIYHGQAGADGLWLGDLNMNSRTGIARYVGRDSTMSYLVPVPQEYESGGPLAGIYNGVSLASWSDTLMVAFAASDKILVLDTLGRLRDSVIVPEAAIRFYSSDGAEGIVRIRWARKPKAGSSGKE